MRLVISVSGRPAPQGSKRGGSAPGTMIEQSVYLPAWRQAVKTAAWRAYREAGIRPDQLPLFPLPQGVAFEVITFRVIRGEQCGAAGSDLPAGAPDIDKLLRSTLDALGGGRKETARLFQDDSQVLGIRCLQKVWATDANGLGPGATLIVTDGRD